MRKTLRFGRLMPNSVGLRSRGKQDVDGRDKRGQDAEMVVRPDRNLV
jgi:hypothetical protein